MRRRWRSLIYYVDEKKLSSLIIVQTMFRINLNLSMKWGCHAFKYFCVALTGSLTHTHIHLLTVHSAAAGQRTDAKSSTDRTKAASDTGRWYTGVGQSQKPKKKKYTHTLRRRRKTASSLFNPIYFMVFDILIFFFLLSFMIRIIKWPGRDINAHKIQTGEASVEWSELARTQRTHTRWSVCREMVPVRKQWTQHMGCVMLALSSFPIFSSGKKMI